LDFYLCGQIHVCVFVKASLIPGFGDFAGRPIWRRALINISAGFFPPMENLTPLMVVGTQVTPASTGPSGVVKYGDIPFSLRLMPKPGPNLSFPLISAIDLCGFIGGAGLLPLPIWAVTILFESGHLDEFSEPSSLAFDEMQGWFLQTLLRQFLLHP
jgi:hypothetical protein